MSFLDALRQAISTGSITDSLGPSVVQGTYGGVPGGPVQADPFFGPGVGQAHAPAATVRRGPGQPRGATKDRVRTRGKMSLEEIGLDETLGVVPAPSLHEALVRSLEAQGQDGVVDLALGIEPELPLVADPKVAGPADAQAAIIEFVEGVQAAGLDEEAGAPVPAPSPAPPDFELPLDLADLPTFANIDGPAGSGKTFWAKELARSNRGVVLAATTGIAAVNLGEGTTINALLRYFNTADLRDKFTGGQTEMMLKRHRKTGLTRILLDEKSMLDADQLTIFCHAIDNVNQDRSDRLDAEGEPEEPEIGLILLGDFAQLAPVPDTDPRDPNGRKKLPVNYAFESPEWARFGEHGFKLTRIRRQGNEEFVRALQQVRRGDLACLDYFRDRLSANTLLDYPGPTIVAKNDAVDNYNQLRLGQLKTAAHDFPSTRWGELRPEWTRHIPGVLTLKEGARVMVLANRNLARGDEPADYLYTNGDLGTFAGPVLSGETPIGALVKLDRTGGDVCVSYLSRDNTIPLEVGRRKALTAEGHAERISEDGKHEIVGQVKYVPLRVAYATTTHKSQGLSLDAVQVNIRDHFFSSPSMLYVALSRARTIEGLRVVGSIDTFRARMQVNPKIKGYL